MLRLSLARSRVGFGHARASPWGTRPSARFLANVVDFVAGKAWLGKFDFGKCYQAKKAAPWRRLGLATAGIFCAVGCVFPVYARQRRAEGEIVLVSRSKRPVRVVESREERAVAVSSAAVALRAVALSFLFLPLALFSPLLLLNIDPLNAWFYTFLRLQLSKAGPVFIKWGQWASTRYDLLPLALCNELSTLTQKAPEHSWDVTQATLKEAFGDTYAEDVVLQVDKKPLASGSVAQIHKAQVNTLAGPCNVAIKVQHPNIHRIMCIDFMLFSSAARVIDRVLGWQTENTLKQFGEHMEDQLDFRREKRNLERFARNFKSWKFVTFPKPLQNGATEKVLIETFEPGHSVIEYLHLHEHDPAVEATRSERGLVTVEAQEKLGSLGLSALLKMIISDNFIHADLHPGNVLVRAMPRPETVFSRIRHHIDANLLGYGHSTSHIPQICFIDAGLSTFLDPSLQEHVNLFFRSLLSYDGANFARSLLAFSVARNPDPRVEEHFVEAMAAKGQMWKECHKGSARSGECMQDALDLVRQFGVHLHPSIVVICGAAITLEGWQYELDPSCSILDHVKRRMHQQERFERSIDAAAKAVAEL